MNDQISFLVDERGRAAGDQLRSRTAVRVIPEAPMRDDRGWRTLLVVASLALVLVGGLAYVSSRPTGGSDVADGAVDPRWLLGELPDGWVVQGAFGPVTAPPTAGFGAIDLYGGAPGVDGPAFALFPVDAINESDSFETVAGRAVLREPDQALGVTETYIAVDDTYSIGMRSKGLENASIDRVLAAARVEGRPARVVVDPATLPAGVAIVPNGDSAFAAMRPVDLVGGDVAPAGMALSGYAPEGDGSVGATLAVTGVVGRIEVAAGLYGTSSTSVPQIGGTVYEFEDSRVLVWERDRLQFSLQAWGEDGPDGSLTVDEMVALAGKVRPASAEEWAQLQP
jgi:hypothetical protein